MPGTVTEPMLDASQTKPLEDAANRIIKKYTLIGTGLGLVPVTGVDVVANTGVQYFMIKELTELYGLPFDEHFARVGMTALGGSVLAGVATYAISHVFGGGGGSSALTEALSGAAISGTYTGLVGELYKSHFQSGGTLENLDVATYVEHIVEQVKSGELNVSSFSNPTRMFSYLTS